MKANLFSFCLTVLALVAAVAAEAKPMELYVATNGNDAWSGRQASPNRAKSDGPLATLAGARDRLRELRGQGKVSGPATVSVRGGTYFLTEPLAFAPQDSETIYAAYRNERPVISGGRRITGWRQEANGLWSAPIADAQGAPFHELFVNGVRRQRPTLPAGDGFYTIAERVPPPDPKQGDDRFRFAPGDMKSSWHNPSDIEVQCYQIWGMARLRIASVDEAARLVTFTGSVSNPDYWAQLDKGRRYRVENVFEALPDQPGTWYLDRPAGVLYYHPLPGEKRENFEAVAPRLNALVALQGDPDAKRWVAGIRLHGLSFGYTDWPLPPQGRSAPQAEVDLGGIINAVGARDCALEDCEVAHIGTYAVEWGRACQRDAVIGCDLHDLGAGGVKIGEGTIRQDPDDQASGNVVENCRIYDGGVVHPAAVGVWIGQSPGNRVAHNDIHDLYYTGVSVGWTWGYGDARAQNTLVEYNHIYNIGRGLLSDMGGIYTLGNQHGSRLTHNLIHDVQSATYGGWGIYFDEGTTDIVAENNIVYHTKTGGFHQHYGKDNLVQNNIFAYAKEAQLQRTRAEDHLSFTFQRNIVLWDTGELLNGNWTDGQFAMDDNLFWDGGKPFTFAGKSLAEWRQTGHGLHSVIADPRFADPQEFNFALRSGSPALALGFQPIDLRGAGAAEGKHREASAR
ncbi:MAG: right-handed parallel beta-helix repeat-containing protein [Armatimonadetes bacterium]|nr:right-handed parallel beta-helix repeat-containing protein [Armatimonadota bacterium]